MDKIMEIITFKHCLSSSISSYAWKANDRGGVKADKTIVVSNLKRIAFAR
jgi:hypothetical protein